MFSLIAMLLVVVVVVVYNVRDLTVMIIMMSWSLQFFLGPA